MHDTIIVRSKINTNKTLHGVLKKCLFLRTNKTIMKELDRNQVCAELRISITHIADTIRKERNSKGISQQTLAYFIESDKCLISEIERGSAKNITLLTLLKISHVLEIPISSLL